MTAPPLVTTAVTRPGFHSWPSGDHITSLSTLTGCCGSPLFLVRKRSQDLFLHFGLAVKLRPVLGFDVAKVPKEGNVFTTTASAASAATARVTGRHMAGLLLVVVRSRRTKTVLKRGIPADNQTSRQVGKQAKQCQQAPQATSHKGKRETKKKQENKDRLVARNETPKLTTVTSSRLHHLLHAHKGPALLVCSRVPTTHKVRLPG